MIILLSTRLHDSKIKYRVPVSCSNDKDIVLKWMTNRPWLSLIELIKTYDNFCFMKIKYIIYNVQCHIVSYKNSLIPVGIILPCGKPQHYPPHFTEDILTHETSLIPPLFFVSFTNFDILFCNCSDSVVIFFFYFIFMRTFLSTWINQFR